MPAPNLIFDGDSLTAGFGLTIPPDVTYPNQTVALLSYAASAVNNVAVGGNTAAQRTAALSSAVYPLWKNDGAPQIVIIWAGTNDLYFGASAATTYANIKAYCTTLRAAKPNAKIIVLDVLPRTNSGTPGTFETDRQTVNTSLRGDFPTSTAYSLIYTGASYADYLVDIGSNTTIGLAGQTTNATYYLDLVHLTSTGYGIVAPYVRNAIYLVNPP